MRTPYFIELLRAKRAGRRDAARNFPQPGEPVSGQLGQYQHNCTSQQIDEAKLFLSFRSRFLNKINDLNERALDQSKELAKRVASWRGRTDGHATLPRWIHLLLQIIGVVTELVFNEIALRPLGLNPVHTFIMVLGVALTLAVLAEWIGRQIKESRWPHKNVAIWGLVALVIALIAVLVAKSRADFALHQEPALVVNAVQLDHGATWLLFTAMQLGFVLLCTITSCMSYDPVAHHRRKYARAIARRDSAYDKHDTRHGKANAEADQDWATYQALQSAYLGANVMHRSGKVSLRDLSTITEERPQILKRCPGLPEKKGDYIEPTDEPEVHVQSKNGRAKPGGARTAKAQEAK